MDTPILSVEDLNKRIINSAMHLFEAGKWMSDIDPTLAKKWMESAEKMLSIIPPDSIEPEYLTGEQMDNIMAEIFGEEN